MLDRGLLGSRMLLPVYKDLISGFSTNDCLDSGSLHSRESAILDLYQTLFLLAFDVDKNSYIFNREVFDTKRDNKECRDVNKF